MFGQRLNAIRLIHIIKFFFSIFRFGKIMVIGLLQTFAHFDDRWDFGIDVVVGEMKACSEGALVQQRVLVKLDLATGIPLVQAHSTVRKVDHLP